MFAYCIYNVFPFSAYYFCISPNVSEIKAWLSITAVDIRLLEVFLNFHNMHCIKYARMWIFTDTDSPVQGQYLRFCPYAGEYGEVKTRILAYFIQGYFLEHLHITTFT